MRFNTVTEDLERKNRYLRYLCYCPHKVFSVDFVYYIMWGYDLDWIPSIFTDAYWINGMQILKPGLRVYTPHSMSMFTEMIRYAVKNIIHHDSVNFDKIHEKLVPPSAENKLERFSNHVHEVTCKLLSRKYVNLVEVLAKFTYIGRLTATFYKHGTRECADIAPYLMSATLMKLTKSYTYAQCFYNLDVAAEKLCEWFRENDDEVINEDFYNEFIDNDVTTCENSTDYDKEEFSNDSEDYFDAVEKF